MPQYALVKRVHDQIILLLSELPSDQDVRHMLTQVAQEVSKPEWRTIANQGRK